MESEIWYGAYTILDKIYVEPIKQKESVSVEKFSHIFEITEIEEDRLNGYNLLKIYINGDLKPIEIGGWVIAPIIRMPFNWGGFSLELELTDRNGNSIVKKRHPDATIFKKISFVTDIEWVMNILKEMPFVVDKEHLELLDRINQVKDRLKFYKDKHVSVTLMKPWFDELFEIEKLYEGKNEQFTKNQNDYFKIAINQLILALNEFEIKVID